MVLLSFGVSSIKQPCTLAVPAGHMVQVPAVRGWAPAVHAAEADPDTVQHLRGAPHCDSARDGYSHDASAAGPAAHGT